MDADKRTTDRIRHSSPRLPALLLGNVALAFGPWLVRLADVGPVAAGFWRLTLALPFLLLVARVTDSSRTGQAAR